jgi:hypothetical protein
MWGLAKNFENSVHVAKFRLAIHPWLLFLSDGVDEGVLGRSEDVSF